MAKELMAEKAAKKVKDIKKNLSVEKYLRGQFLKIGIVVGVLLLMLGAFAGYEGLVVAKHNTSIGLNDSTRVVVMTVVLAVFIFLSVLGVCMYLQKISKNTIKRIKEPVGIMDEMMSALAEGNLIVKTGYEYNDEFAKMIKNGDSAVEELKKYVSSISETMENMSNKNMNIQVNEEYVGEFESISKSMKAIVDSLNDTFSELKMAFSQVKSGADSLADSAQAMSNGAQMQEKHIKMLVENIENVSKSVHHNTIAAEGVEKLSKDSMEKMGEGERKMHELSEAMDLIRKESNEIENIIEVIAGIAEQTNLLALNASIEAARAGEHGKGFAVVASEIGALASSSSEASQNITDLIHKSIVAVDNGVSITGETVQMLNGISQMSSEISNNITGITEDSRKQDAYLKDMISSANEIESVVDQNTSLAEESSALSEELLGHTDSVMDMIEQYKLRD